MIGVDGLIDIIASALHGQIYIALSTPDKTATVLRSYSREIHAGNSLQLSLATSAGQIRFGSTQLKIMDMK